MNGVANSVLTFQLTNSVENLWQNLKATTNFRTYGIITKD